MIQKNKHTNRHTDRLELPDTEECSFTELTLPSQDLKITQNLGDVTGQAEALNNLSCALRMLGKYSEASLAADKQLTLAGISKNKRSEASAKYNAGVVAYM